MGVLGEVEIVKSEAVWDEDTQTWTHGKHIETIKEKNNIGGTWQQNLRSSSNPSGFSTTYDIIMHFDRRRGPLFQRGDSAGTAVAGDPVTEGVWTDRVPLNIFEPAVSLGYRLWRHRFDPPSSGQRDISTIALQSNATTVDDVACGLTLTELCVQTDSQILDIFYRVYVDDETTGSLTSGVSKRHIFEQGKGMFASTTNNKYFPSYLGYDWWKSDIPSYSQKIWRLVGTRSASGQASRLLDCMTFDSDTMASADAVGYFFGSASQSMSYNGGSTWYWSYRSSQTPMLPAGNSKMQSTFPKLKSSIIPYLDIDNQAVGTGTVTINEVTPGSSWAPTDHSFAELFRILITTSGDIATSEYKLVKRVQLPTAGEVWSCHEFITTPQLPSWAGTGFQQGDTNLPCTNDDGIRHNVHGPVTISNSTNQWMEENMPTIFSYNYPEFISVGPSYGDTYVSANNGLHGVTIYDLKGHFLNLNANTTVPNALGTTDIRQVATEDDGTIWLACSNTGLWKITRAGDLSLGAGAISTIARLDPTEGSTTGLILNNNICRGVVARKTNGVAAAGAELWAIFDKEMCKSLDSGVTWTVYNDTSIGLKDGIFTLTGVTAAADDASGLMHFEMDHHWTSGTVATDRRFFIVNRLAPATTDGRGFWWSTDLVDNPSGLGVAVSLDSLTTTEADWVSHKIIGQKSIYAGKDADWYFSIDDSDTGIMRVAYNATVNSGETANLSVATRCGSGIMVWFDDAGLDWIVGHQDVGSIESVTGRRPQDVTNTGGAYIVLAWRLFNSASNSYEAYVGGLQCHVGNGIWLSYNTGNTDGRYARYYQFDTSSSGGMNSSGVVTDTQLWEEYGWDGGAWVLGNANSKLTHTSVDALIDGLEISFVGGDAGSFTDTDMYDAYVFDGVIKDNATIIDYDFYPNGLPLVRGTEFADPSGTLTTIVPVSPAGAITSELAVAGWWNSTNDYLDTSPGWLGLIDHQGTNGQHLGQCEQVLSGDFTVEFKMSSAYHNSGYSSGRTRLGLMNATDAGVETHGYDYGFWTINTAAYTEIDDTRQVVVGNGSTSGTITAFADHVFQRTDSVQDNYFTKDNLDTFRIQRISNEIRYAYKRNGGAWTDLYGQGGEWTTSNDLILVMDHYGAHNNVFYDVHITYSDPRYFVFVGNGTDTGPGNLQGTDGTPSALPDKNFRGLTRSSLSQMSIEVEDTPASGIYTSRTLVGSSSTGLAPGYAPAVGEVAVLFCGKLVFNSADAGKEIRGNWIYSQQLNLLT